MSETTRRSIVLDVYSCEVYDGTMVRSVFFKKGLEKILEKKIPIHVVRRLQEWVDDVRQRGLEEVRKTPGYHDEPLKGKLRGMRSIRLSKGWRAYYVVEEEEIQFVLVLRVDKHEY
jgi:toxin HigB-1